MARALLSRGEAVIGLDNLNDYYSVDLKRARLSLLEREKGFTFRKIDVSNKEDITTLVEKLRDVTDIVHLAAQAGVRYSLEDPFNYINSNIIGHLVLLEIARKLPRLRHFVYASSSSVYGGNVATPFSETDRVDLPTSIYAVTKRADELMSYAYGHLYALPQTGLRFFTVYGPWGRPDMAYYLFARAIVSGNPITLYDGGRLKRDFTYIDDIVDGLIGVLDCPPQPKEFGRVLNIGNNHPEAVSDLISHLEERLMRKAVIHHVQRPRTDVEHTYASIDAINALTGFRPRTSLKDGIGKFVAWFEDFHRTG